jgi:outer membrane protein assembly factor BamA
VAVDVDGLEDVEARDQLWGEVHRRLPLGSRFEHARYIESRDALALNLRRHGYAWAEVEGKVEVDTASHAARIRLKAVPGPAVRFGHVRVVGVQSVREHLVARQARVREGERFNLDRIGQVQGRLQALDLFSSVRVDLEPSAQDPAVADVVIHAREAAPAELRLGGGFGLESFRTDVYASAVYLRRHWLGGLRTLQLRLDPGWAAVPTFWNSQRMGPSLLADVTLVQNDWPRRWQLTVGAAYELGVEYAFKYGGGHGRLALKRGFWHDNVLLTLRYEIEVLQFFDTDPVLVQDPVAAGRFFGYQNPYRVGWLEEDAALDLRDNPIAAHRGFFLGVSFEQGGPYAGGAFTYEKIVPDVRAYLPLGPRVTFATRFLFGQLFDQGSLGSPITRRFYLGGPNTHRGFSYDRLSPQIPSGTPGAPAIPVGGNQMVLASVELRVDVGRVFANMVTLAAFVDGGDVGATHVAWGDLNWATGGGLRYGTPLGTFRFDVGVRLNRVGTLETNGLPNPDPGERIAFHLSLGEAF